MIEIQPKNDEKLIIESITLLDGITPDEEVQYKVGRDVAKLAGVIGCRFIVFYNEKRGWRTNPVVNVEENAEKVVIKDNISIYTFKKVPVQTD